MTFILILNPHGDARHPAVIGGFATELDAENAGKDALLSPHDKKMRSLQREELNDYLKSVGYRYSWSPTWKSYTVIPSAIQTPEKQ